MGRMERMGRVGNGKVMAIPEILLQERVQGTKTAGLVWNFCMGPSIRLAN